MSIGRGHQDQFGLGIAIACLVDSPKRKIVSASPGKYEDAPEVDLVSWSENELGLPLTIETDVSPKARRKPFRR